MSKQYQMAQHVYCCETGERTVFLDLIRDRYYILRDRQSAWFSEIQAAAHAGRPTDDIAAAFARHLCAMGILSEAPVGQRIKPVALPDPPSGAHFGSVGLRTVRPGLSQTVYFLTALADALRLEIFASISGQTEAARRWKEKASRSSAATLSDITVLTDTFHKLTPYFFSTHDACRWRSLVLFRFLTLQGIQPDWVFGVRTRPFAAHCWIEAGSVILNDHFETVSPFTPIMKV